MSLALYRKYRSRTLDEIVGQDHVTTLLRRAIDQDKVAHAYLFTGPRGVGKTSIARIVAHEINKLPYSDESLHLDIIEIDAASNNGVEDIRDLRDRVQIAPVNARRKVYIIDEVHMLSKAAFNALLKTLEEPPEHVVFILATTDIDKVPDTIRSRTQRYSFRRASETDIITNLKRIAKAEKLSIEEDAYTLIAQHADGSYRDSVSLFDQLTSGGENSTLTVADVTSILGLASDTTVRSLITAVEKNDISMIDTTLRELESSGIPTRTTVSQLLTILRSRIVDTPAFASLIEALLSVTSSQYPELKLLSVLSAYVQKDIKPRAQAPSVSTPPVVQAKAPSAPKPRSSEVAVKSPVAKEASIQPVEPEESIETAPAKEFIAADSPFDWQKFIEYARTNHVAMFSVLSKCEPEVIDGVLKLYTKSAFYKKKLDDAKYRLLLNSSLHECGYQFDVETIATARPLKDSQAARVAAIMGGGEEVSVADA